jgi:hypothetical protein
MVVDQFTPYRIPSSILPNIQYSVLLPILGYIPFRQCVCVCLFIKNTDFLLDLFSFDSYLVHNNRGLVNIFVEGIEIGKLILCSFLTSIINVNFIANLSCKCNANKEEYPKIAFLKKQFQIIGGVDEESVSAQKATLGVEKALSNHLRDRADFHRHALHKRLQSLSILKSDIEAVCGRD